MSIKTTILSDSELAKTTVMNSPLDEDTKRSLITFITTSALATNGISQEEKIQSLTESMASLASALGSYMAKADSRIGVLEEKYKAAHPEGKIDQLRKLEAELYDVEEYRNMNGIVPNVKIKGVSLSDKLEQIEAAKAKDQSQTMKEELLGILHRPYVWIFGCVAICSPYASDMLNMVLQHFCK